MKLMDRGADVFTFIERTWCCKEQDRPKSWAKTRDNVALLHVLSWDDWWTKIGKKTRNMVRKAQKADITTRLTVPDANFARSVWQILNETPIRQGRAYPHYGAKLSSVTQEVMSNIRDLYIGAYLQDELVGFVQLALGQETALLTEILSLQKHWDKAINNFLISKSVEVCIQRRIQYIIYGRIGNHPSLDEFKINNGFSKFPLTRYYVALTRKGRIALKLGLYRDFKDLIPAFLKPHIIPVFNWVSRAKLRTRFILGQRKET